MKTTPLSLLLATLMMLLMGSVTWARAQCIPATIVRPPPSVVIPPCSTQCAEFQVAAVGSEPLHYQWLFHGLVLSNANAPTLTLCGINAKEHAGAYQVVVRNDCGAVTSQVATLTFAKLNAAPVITCPSNLLAWTCESRGAIVRFPPPAASDPDGTEVKVTCVPAAGSWFPTGVTSVGCAATDACGRTNTCQFSVTVRLDKTETVPVIHSIVPTLVGTFGGTPLLVSGDGFGRADEILIAGAPLVDAVWNDATGIRGVTPPLPRGEHLVELRRCGAVLARATVKVLAEDAPQLHSVVPAVVLAGGGAQVTMLGTGLLPATVFRLGFPSSRAGDNQLLNVRVAADGKSATGQVPALPAGMLYGSRALIAEDARGRSVLEAGVRYVPVPEVKDAQFLAMENLRAVSRRKPSFEFVNGFPTGVRMSVAVEGVSGEAKARAFLNLHKDLYLQVAPDKDLRLLRSQSLAGEHLLFGQTYQGIPVFGAQVVISLNGGEVFSTAGKLLPTTRLDARRMRMTPTLSAEQAEASARKYVSRPLAPLKAATVLEVFELSLLAKAELNPQLVWHVNLGSAGGECFVSAHTGEVVFNLTSDHESGGSLHDFDFDLQDAEDEANAKDDDCFWGSDDVDVADEDWFNSDYNGDPDAVQANQHARDAYAFFHNQFNWHSYDNDSSQLEVFIHATVPNASWSAGCELIQISTGWVDFEVMVHEFTHGIVQSTSDLIYTNQSGALNESYADIMAVVADREAGDLNWTLFENRTGFTGSVRDLQNPTIDRFSSYLTTTSDSGGVHSNSGIGNKTAFLMANGGTFNFVTMPAMGLTKMRNLKFTALQLLPNNADFATARSVEIAVAQYWVDHGEQGFVQSDVCSVRNAWAAVEVGLPDFGCDGDEDIIVDMDGDSFPDWADNCPWTANPNQLDSDGDGRGDACDNCVSHPNWDQHDTDNDGKGDACDDDIDNDGCKNSVDQHPNDASVPVGKYVGPCCNGTLYGFEGNDSDGDGVLDCKDEDDDDDGIPDAADNCPIGNIGTFGCLTIEPCPCPPNNWYLDCVGGDCVELFAKWVRVVNPDPTREIIVDKIAMANRRLYLFPHVGNSMEQMLSTMMKGVGLDAATRVSLPYQLEIWTRATPTRPARRLSVAGILDANVRLSPLNLGGIIAVKPPTEEGFPMTIGGTWFIGGDPAFADSDSDRDGLFDGWEVTHGLNPRDPLDAMRDNDGDGATNRDEQAAGTDPNNGSDAFKILQFMRGADGVFLQFSTVQGAVYQVQRAPAMNEAWENVDQTIAGTGQPAGLKIPGAASSNQFFYRVRQVAK